jgi:hypothetical protein
MTTERGIAADLVTQEDLAALTNNVFLVEETPAFSDLLRVLDIAALEGSPLDTTPEPQERGDITAT